MGIGFICKIYFAWSIASTTFMTAASDDAPSSNGLQLRGSSSQQRQLAYNGQITSLQLINANSSNDIGNAVPLFNGAQISLSSFGLSQPNFSINAVAAGDTIGSVQLNLNNGQVLRSESMPLYALCGNNGNDFTTCPKLGLGNHTITATAYSGAGSTGDKGGSLTITFAIVSGPPPPMTPTTPPPPLPTPLPPAPPTPSPPTGGTVAFAKRINIAGPTYKDANGNVWEADTVLDGKNAGYFCDGNTDTIGQTVNDILYCTYKWYATTNSAVPFRRELPVDQDGIFQVRLHFAELHFTEAKKRMFDVKVENVMVASKLDVFVSAGGAKKAYVIELNNVDCRDGKMTIEFAQSVNNPILSGLEVIRYGQPVTKTCGIPKFLDTNWKSTGGTALAYPFFLAEGQGGMIGKDFVITSGYFQGYKQATAKTFALDTTNPSATWRPRDDIPIALGVTHAATLIVGTKMYVMGGYLGGDLGTGGVGQELADVLVYDHSALPGNQWSRLPNLPQARAGGGGFYDSRTNALFFSGGATRPEPGSQFAIDHRETWKYSFNNPGAGWVRVADGIFLANHQQYATAIDASGNERHYIMGGQKGADEANGNLANLAEYDVAANQWIPRKDMPIPRSHASSSTRPYGCGFIIITGTTNGGRTDDVSYYEPSSDQWYYLGKAAVGLNTPVGVIASINGEDWMITETGWTGSNYSYRRRISPS